MSAIYHIDSNISLNIENGNYVGWKAIIKKNIFHKLPQLSNYKKTFYLDYNKYKNYFQQYLQLLNTLPSKFLKYEAYIDGDNVVIIGLTDTTVRVSILELSSY